MEKQIITTQTLDYTTAQKAIKSASNRVSPFVIYIIIFCLFFIINLTRAFFSDSESTTQQNDKYENTSATASNSTPWLDILVSLIPIFVLVITFTLVMRFIKKRAVKKQFEKKARHFTNVTYTINPDFLKMQGDGFESTQYWEEMHKVKETKEFYVIFSEKLRAHIIDKAQLDPWQAEEIKEIFGSLNSKIKVSLK